MTEPNTKPLLTGLMINEYAQKEENLRWYFSMLGDLAHREPDLWQWANQEMRADIMGLNQASGGMLGNPNPNLASDVMSVLKKWLVRGFFFGMRREGVIYTPAMETNPLTDELDLNPKHQKMPEEKWGEIESDFDDETFA